MDFYFAIIHPMSNTLFFYNSLSRKKETFIPIDPKEIRVYTCGPTVYNFAHIGNLRTYIFNDLLQRTLIFLGYNVKRVMNITDVGHLSGDGDMGMDKVEKAASEKGMNAWQLSDYYLEAFKKDMERLNMLSPTIWEKATATIKEQINLISQIEQKGFTYKTSDGIYFDTSKFPEYGAMSSLTNDGIKEAARVDFNAERKNPRDFALWKFNTTGKKRAMEWDSPWGIGFPGWHTECSAISLKHLGNPFDIHTGAIDHKETHHPNEIAQTEVATGKKMANFWLHAGFLNAESDQKMAKSKGNFLTLQSVIDRGINPLAYRLYTYGMHWRQTAAFSWEALGGATRAFGRLQVFVQENLPNSTNLPNYDDRGSAPAGALPQFKERFLQALSDDLNMPQAMAVVWDLVNTSKKGNFQAEAVKLLLDFDRVLALGFSQIIPIGQIPENISKLIAEREQARASKNYALADKLRDQIQKLGHTVVDKQPIVWYNRQALLV